MTNPTANVVGGYAGADGGRQKSPQVFIDPKESIGKTPISILQESCLRRGITPAYELMASEGQVHEPTFMFRVTVNEMSAFGSGKSKKIAKHLAAKGILEQIVANGDFAEWGIPGRSVGEARDFLNSLVAEGGKSKGAVGKVEEMEDGDGGNAADNPIGKLQEKCTKNHWPVPEYDLVEERGQPHDRTFAVTVKLGRYEEKSEAKSKKVAKRMAAELMLKRLNEIPKGEYDEDALIEEEVGEPGDAYPKDLEEQLSSLQPEPVETMPIIGDESGVSIQDLDTVDVRSLPLCNDTLELLKNVMPKEHILKPTFYSIPRLSRDGQYQCLVQLSTTPVAVCYGIGETKDLAHFSAARNALEYLKVMSKAGM